MVIPLSGVGHQRVTHPFATLTFRRVQRFPFDLHALGTPLAFILSQDQTLRRKFFPFWLLFRNCWVLKLLLVSITLQLLRFLARMTIISFAGFVSRTSSESLFGERFSIQATLCFTLQKPGTSIAIELCLSSTIRKSMFVFAGYVW